MPSFEIRVAPRSLWELQLQGSDNVQFNGPLIQGAYGAMADCAERSGCMEEGQLRVNDSCVETYERYLAPNGFGMRVRQAAGSSDGVPEVKSTKSEWR